MKTKFTLMALLVTASSLGQVAKAQSSNTKLNIGAESGLALGNFKDTYKASFGITLEADLPVADQLYADVNAGYVNFFAKERISGTSMPAVDIHLLPVTAGLKYFPQGKFYIQANIGAAFALNKTDVGYSKGAAFLYVPQIGYEIPVGDNSSIDVGIRYEATTSYKGNPGFSKIQLVGLRIAYDFGL